MDPELLRAFVAVVDAGGFTAAARTLHRTQSAVSLQIKRLESRVGEPVFRRDTRSVTLTEAGGALLPYARRILRLQDEAAAALDTVGRARSLRLGISDEQALAYLPRVIPAFAARHPEVHLEVVCDLSTRLIARMEDGELDLALTIRHGTLGTGEVVGREQLAWVARADFANVPEKPLPVAFSPEGCIYRAHALAGMTRLQRACRVVFVSPSPTGINLAVQAGMAATVKAARAVPAGCRILDGEPGIPALPPVDVELHRAPTAVSEVADSFIEMLLNEVAAAEDITMLPGAYELVTPTGIERDLIPRDQ